MSCTLLPCYLVKCNLSFFSISFFSDAGQAWAQFPGILGAFSLSLKTLSLFHLHVIACQNCLLSFLTASVFLFFPSPRQLPGQFSSPGLLWNSNKIALELPSKNIFKFSHWQASECNRGSPNPTIRLLPKGFFLGFFFPKGIKHWQSSLVNWLSSLSFLST